MFVLILYRKKNLKLNLWKNVAAKNICSILNFNIFLLIFLSLIAVDIAVFHLLLFFSHLFFVDIFGKK